MSPWPFVGRHREVAYLRAELASGRSVVLTGPFGIGRTSLVEQVATQMAADWRFVFSDLQRTPGAVWRELFAETLPKARAGLRSTRLSARALRVRVSALRLEDPRRHVVVLDNIARLSAQRLELLRRLRERFQVLAILEAFLSPREQDAVCSVLRARCPLELGHLGPRATVAFFRECSRRHGFAWGEAEIRGLARAVGGFPTGMREAVAAELRRRA
jgi:hypothetical protein